MDKVRLGIIGVGNMGSSHIKNALKGLMPEIEITAVADIKPDRLEWAKEQLPEVKTFDSASALMDSGEVDAILIATPHYDHPVLAIEGLEKGLHVMSEKPAGVFTKKVREMNAAADKSDKIFGIMFNQRTNCLYRKAHELVHSGKYGEMKRVTWIITDWYRTQAYYNSGGWRATWSGEGGGVLLNQCPHQLDLWQWICGMPEKITAVCHEGKWHNIEVEDDVMIYAEYANGATGTFITTTGDYPGTNRLEITLDRAKLICENGVLTVFELEQATSDYTANAEDGFGSIQYKTYEAELDGNNVQHPEVMNKFAGAILRGEPLTASGQEGINGLMISNAAFLSSWLGKTVSLPIDEDLFYNMLQEKINNSTFVKEVKETVNENMDSTY
ncbi:MAG: Gfo/Idh/MocA family oxidoreductase [Clostridia bacterium]|nr:Gfo/Idh/MocA family oxidoreductase [Clostridia bacterium]MBO5432735.1 Gfo/Idh/MocA family oxidoreductase [Clostridia bacterium]MBP3559710.1 Gfo/Idh/MocA family oxidoreductase [Clostridia bacterium]MBQ6838402.1 Gfo/Idh/MocA family oxidoreductase [Clostridia bacterium]